LQELAKSVRLSLIEEQFLKIKQRCVEVLAIDGTRRELKHSAFHIEREEVEHAKAVFEARLISSFSQYLVDFHHQLAAVLQN